MAETFFRDFAHSSVGPITVEFSFRSDEGASIVTAWTNTPGFAAVDICLPDEEREELEAKITETHVVEPFDDWP
jgi:hypothetical protein